MRDRQEIECVCASEKVKIKTARELFLLSTQLTKKQRVKKTFNYELKHKAGGLAWHCCFVAYELFLFAITCSSRDLQLTKTKRLIIDTRNARSYVILAKEYHLFIDY